MTDAAIFLRQFGSIHTQRSLLVLYRRFLYLKVSQCVFSLNVYCVSLHATCLMEFL
jgi:hypothetical protein